MQTWIKRDRQGVPADRSPRDLAELGARIREAAILAAALHLGATAQELSRGEANDARPTPNEEAGR
jgi:hypothetical protein